MKLTKHGVATFYKNHEVERRWYSSKEAAENSLKRKSNDVFRKYIGTKVIEMYCMLVIRIWNLETHILSGTKKPDIARTVMKKTQLPTIPWVESLWVMEMISKLSILGIRSETGGIRWHQNLERGINT